MIINNAQLRIMENFSFQPIAGFRFWDTVTGTTISDGLRVAAYPSQRPNLRRTEASLSPRSGIYTFNRIAGLSSSGLCIIEVTDSERRFLPFSLQTRLPLSDLYQWSDDTPGSPLSQTSPALPGAIPLFSAVTRQPPAGQAVVRAALWDGIAKAPAAFAMLELYYNGQLLARGLADDRGQCVSIFAYPEQIIPFIAGSTSPIVQSALEWPLQISVSYRGASSSPPEAYPNLSELVSRPVARAWLDDSQSEELKTIFLKAGQELVVRSTHSSGDHTPLSTLIITR